LCHVSQKDTKRKDGSLLELLKQNLQLTTRKTSVVTSQESIRLHYNHKPIKFLQEAALCSKVNMELISILREKNTELCKVKARYQYQYKRSLNVGTEQTKESTKQRKAQNNKGKHKTKGKYKTNK
jgi:hypothetical protein